MSYGDTDRRTPPSAARTLWVDAERRSTGKLPTADARDREDVATVSAAAALERLRTDDRVACVASGPDPGTDPVAFLQAVRVQAPSVPVFLVVGDGEDPITDQAYQAGVTDCLVAGRDVADGERVLDLLERAAVRHRQSETLRAASPSQEAVLESVPDGVGVARGGSFIAGNRTLRDLVGDSALGGIDPRDIVGTESVSRAREGGSVERQVGVSLDRASGSTVLADVTVLPVEWHGRPAALVVCRSRAGSGPVLESQLRLREAIGAAGHAVYTTGPEGTIRYVNAAFEDITGYAAQEALGETPKLFRSGLMSEAHYQDLWDTVLAGETWQEVVANRRKNGDIYYADQTVAPVTADGEIQGFVAIQSDITTQKEIEDDLRAFKSILERIGDPIMIQDAEGDFQVVNDAVSELTGLSKGELIGNDEFAFMDEASAREVREMKERALRRGEPVSYELSPTLPSDRERTFSTVRYPEYDSDGEPVGTVAICRDVTDIKEHQRQFGVVERVLRHNVRNQIQVVRGVTETISDEGSGDIEAYAQRVLEASDTLLETIEKQRETTAFLSENRTTRPADIVQVTRAVVERLRGEYPKATVTVDTPETCRVCAVSPIERAIRELVENALVHSDRPRPTVDITIERGDSHVRVEIADDGPGIPAIERCMLTGREETGPLKHGRGLGLWIAHLILRESDGGLEFGENEPRGSVLTVTMPRVHVD